MDTMRKVIRFHGADVVPSPQEVLEAQGMTGRKLPERIQTLLDSALELFKELASPIGVLQQWPIADFPTVFDGNGLNDPDGPVRVIVPKADAIALFVATLGNELMTKSSELFKQGGRHWDTCWMPSTLPPESNWEK